MFRSFLENESGYSLVEVIVSILILTAAIVPMVGMFDAGLRAATKGGEYDQARALAKKQLESAQSLPYNTVRTNFPSSAGPPACSPAAFNGAGSSSTANCGDGDFPGFTYDVQKQFVRANNPPAGTNVVFSPVTANSGMMQITVSVNWRGNTYRSTTIKTR